MAYQFIVADSEVLGGKPRIRGTRLSVAFILELFASGATRQEILEAYPQLTAEALDEVLRYALESVENEVVFVHKLAA